MSTSNKFEDSAIIVDDSDTDDFRDGVIKELTEENQQLRKKCKAANKSLAALKEQLRSLKEEDDVIEDLTEENEQLKKEYDTAISECAALEKQLRSLQKRVCVCIYQYIHDIVCIQLFLYICHSVCMCELQCSILRNYVLTKATNVSGYLLF
jgi:dynactin complex subunit